MATFILAKSAGFCFGVKRAIDIANEELEKSKKIISIGPIIHNEVVINDLEKRGLNTFLGDISEIKNEKVLIRSHGIEKEKFEILSKNQNEIIDLTCPFVKKIHNAVEEYSKKGKKTIVIGDKDHQEVKGIISYAENPIFVINSEEDIEKIKGEIGEKDNILVVFQTTANIEKSKKLVDILNKLFYNITVLKTICNATNDRQEEVMNLSKQCDVFFVIGSNSSSNTKKLFDVAKMNCDKVYLINQKEDLDHVDIKENAVVGISAGASAPDYLIREILSYARSKF